MRLVSYNVHGCVGADRRYDPARIMRVMAQLQADVLGLQEVGSRAGPHADAFDALTASSGMHAVAGPNIRNARGQYGNLVLSRWPAAAVRRLDLSIAGRAPATGAAPRTFPSWLPMLAMDRIQVWLPHALRSLHVHATTLARHPSDHLPLVAELARTA